MTIRISHTQSSNRSPLLYAIGEKLRSLSMVHWFPVLLKWMDNYDGYISFSNELGPYSRKICLEMDDMPLEQINQTLDLLLSIPKPCTNQILAKSLSRLECLTWRARIDDELHPNSYWDSTQNKFSQLLFLAGFEKQNRIVLWQSDTEFPETNVVEVWLLTQIQAETLRRDRRRG